MKRSLRTNITVVYLMGFFHSFMLVIPVFVPLLQGYGLSMSQVLQTQALFALTVAIFEVPSGYLADIWGRRRAVIVGSLLNGFGFLSLLWADSFVDFLVYEVLLGLGFSLISGADLALLCDSETILAERGEGGGAGASKSLSRLIAIEAGASGVAGIAASLLLIYSDMQLLLALQAVCGFMPLLLGVLLIETPRPQFHLGHSAMRARLCAYCCSASPLCCGRRSLSSCSDCWRSTASGSIRSTGRSAMCRSPGLAIYGRLLP